MNIAAVIPCYNGANFIADAIEAILAQSEPASEVIVVDDCSQDDSRDIVANYSDRVILLSTEQNSGVQVARNIGIRHARADWIALCDHDDIWMPRYLANLSRLLCGEPGIEFVFCNFQRLQDKTLETVTKFDQAPQGYWELAGRRVIPEGWVFDRNFAGQTFLWHPIFPSAISFSKRLVAERGEFNPAMRGFRPEDGEFVLRCLYRAKVAAIPEPLVAIRRHEANSTGDDLLTLLDEIRLLRWIRENHPEARQYSDIIDREIRRRRITAVNGAFASRRHDLMRELLADIPRQDRSTSMRIKASIAWLPDRPGLFLNGMLQGTSGYARLAWRMMGAGRN
ncbi:MAG TPA: glycosyltransferase family 2 protein [Acetobacteraceae bacterium]